MNLPCYFLLFDSYNCSFLQIKLVIALFFYVIICLFVKVIITLHHQSNNKNR